MGANATTFVPTYVASEILTAADLNVTNSGIPVFSTTVTRDAGFGGSGEKVLAEGQFAYIEATNTTQYYDGAAWQAVGNGFTFISSVTATAGASATIDNCFSSTYENYKILITGSSSADTGLNLQLRVGGVTAATNYGRQRIVASSTTVTAARSTSDTGFIIGGTENSQQVFTIEVSKPAVAAQTGFIALCNYQSGTPTLLFTVGQHSTATAYDGFIISPSSGTISMTAYVYGYGK
jgi:hypothetical protein